MPRPDSLGFRLLDAHVVAGRADELALTDASGSLTVAQLLHESAVVAGGIEQLGAVGPGWPIAVELSGRERVLAALAIVRLGAHPGDGGARLTLASDGPALVTASGETHGWGLLRELGRVEPARALRHDADGYDDVIAAAFPDLVEPLLRGELIAL